MSNRRLARHNIHEDPMSAAWDRVAAYARGNGRGLGIGLGVLAVAVIAFLLWNSTRSGNQSAARLLLGQAQQSINQGQVDQAATTLEDLIRRYGGTPAGRNGRLLMGQIELQRSNNAAAVGHFEAFIAASSPSDYLWAGAQRGRGTALENEGHFADAARAYEESLRGPLGDSEKALALLDAGRAWALAGSTDVARKDYQRIIDEYPGTRAVGTARERVAELGS